MASLGSKDASQKCWITHRKNSNGEFTQMDARTGVGNPLDYCLGRMVGAVGIVRIGAAMSLSSAEARINDLVKACPGRYITFSETTGRVVAKSN
jgi:hypothetical protein